MREATRASRHWRAALWRGSSNPLVTTVVAFLLTGLLGGYFSHVLDERAREREEAAEARARQQQEEAAARGRAVEALRDVTDLLYERRARSELLASAIRRGAREAEIVARKQAYDDAYLRWNARLQSNLFRIREITGSARRDEYSAFEAKLEAHLAPLLRAADACVTRAFDLALSGSGGAADDARRALDECALGGSDRRAARIAALHVAILNCSYAFTNGLYTTVQLEAARGPLARDVAAEMTARCAL